MLKPKTTKIIHPPEQLLLNEVQVLLAEKRTYYALLRSAIAVFTLPLSVVIFLIGTAHYHGLFNRSWVSMVVMVVLLLISFAGISMVIKANEKIKKIHRMIETIKSENKRLAEIVIE